MMDRTDRHFRAMIRAMSRHTLLYSEMLTTGAIIHGDRDKLLSFSPVEHPLSLQIGGSDPEELGRCAAIAQDWGYDEVNLNVGCPSDRVQNAMIGACLMAHPKIVADCVAAMRAACSLPITVKHRIGIDNLESYEDMIAFVDAVAAAGCRRFTVHARVARLQGLSPKENREIPPLRVDEVARLKRERPHLFIELNGGVRSLEAVESHLQNVDAVMLGRIAYEDPYFFASVDQRIFDDPTAKTLSRHEVVESLYPYFEAGLGKGWRLHSMVRHLLPLFSGQPGTRRWKRTLSEGMPKADASIELIQEALRQVPRYTS